MATSNPDTMQALTGQSTSGVNNAINTPPQQDFNTPAMEGSMQQFLADNIGEFVVVEFLIGTQNLVRRAGILYTVGTSVMTLYDETNQTFITCDIFSVKFVTFYFPGRRPWQINMPASPGQMSVSSQPPMGGLLPGQTTGNMATQMGGNFPSQAPAQVPVRSPAQMTAQNSLPLDGQHWEETYQTQPGWG